MYVLILEQLEIETLHAGMHASLQALSRMLAHNGIEEERSAILELIHTHESILAQIEENLKSEKPS